jgi:hypothetical protein
LTHPEVECRLIEIDHGGGIVDSPDRCIGVDRGHDGRYFDVLEDVGEAAERFQEERIANPCISQLGDAFTDRYRKRSILRDRGTEERSGDRTVDDSQVPFEIRSREDPNLESFSGRTGVGR